MILKPLKNIDVQDERTIGDLAIDVKSFPYKHELFEVEFGNFEAFEVGDSLYKNALSEMLIASFRLNTLQKEARKHAGLQSEVKKLQQTIEKLKKTKVNTMMALTGLVITDATHIIVSYSGAKLGMLNPVVEMSSIDVLSQYNPFNVDYSNMPSENRPRMMSYKYERYVNTKLDKYIFRTLVDRPVELLHLAPYVAEAAECYQRATTVGTAMAPLMLLSNIRRSTVVDDQDYQLVEEIPRSLEEMFRLTGYRGNIPISDTPIAFKHQKVGTSVSTMEITALDYLVLEAYNQLDGVELMTKYQDRKGGLTTTTLDAVREQFRCLYYINSYDEPNEDLILKVDLHKFLSNTMKQGRQL